MGGHHAYSKLTRYILVTAGLPPLGCKSAQCVLITVLPVSAIISANLVASQSQQGASAERNPSHRLCWVDSGPVDIQKCV